MNNDIYDKGDIMTFTYDTCNKALSTSGHLTRHVQVVHDNIKDVKCNKCAYMCSNNSELKRHTKHVHDKIKDIKCDKCEYACATTNQLKAHVKAVHDRLKDKNCGLCGLSFSFQGSLDRHITAIHTKFKKYVCTVCDSKFCTNFELKLHIKKVHQKIRDIKCAICDYATSTKSHLARHMRNVHERPQMDKKMSLGEYAIYTFLSKHNITFENEKKFDDLLSSKGNKLRYDYALPHNNTYKLIEFDGAQHFRKVKWNSTNTEQQVTDKYNYIVECDRKKDDYAQQHNYPLLRIKYTDFNNVDNILTEFLKPFYTQLN